MYLKSNVSCECGYKFSFTCCIIPDSIVIYHDFRHAPTFTLVISHVTQHFIQLPSICRAGISDVYRYLKRCLFLLLAKLEINLDQFFCWSRSIFRRPLLLFVFCFEETQQKHLVAILIFLKTRWQNRQNREWWKYQARDVTSNSHIWQQQ